MISHHPVFEKFTGFKGEAAAGCDRDFIGSSIQHHYWSVAHRDTAIQVEAPRPAFDEEYFEWIDLLESVVEARDSYTMIELGAGYGRWSVRSGLAMQQYGRIPIHLVAVEAEPVHFEWLKDHFRTNGIDPARHNLMQAAVSASDGSAEFYVGSPLGNDRPDQWYGQTLASERESFKPVKNQTHAGFAVHRNEGGWNRITVPRVSMRGILKNRGRIDLIDLDVQGEELTAIQSAIGDLDKTTRRLHIGTHSTEIENGLRRLLTAHKWECRADFGFGKSEETPYGAIAFGDGVQSWVNPRLA
jgi:FkbM family methyltransferase